VREIVAEELRSRFAGVPDAVADPLVAIQVAAKLGELSARFPEARCTLMSAGDRAVGYLISADTAGGVRLCDIAVSTRSRGQGVGRSLLAALLAEADAAGAAVELSVWHAAPAYDWYLRHGFAVTGGDPQAYLEMRREYPGIHSVA